MLYGRQPEEAALDALLAAARKGRGGALVLRGEAGIGKSALLERLAETANTPAHAVLRVNGCEAERDLVGAGLLQLLWPLQELVAQLPAPQAEALRTVLGGSAAPADRYTTGLALLTLLARLAESGSVVCLVDDAQWLDQNSADALLFAARRISAEPVALVFAARDDGFDARGLTELVLPRLDRRAAAQLLDPYRLSAPRRTQVLDAADGNPLALLEFGRNDRGSGPCGGQRVTDRVLASFRDTIAELPGDVRLLLLTAAADSSRDLASVLAAVDALGGDGPQALEAAERAGLLHVDGARAAFRHPLVRAAAYQGAASVQRTRVHRELAARAADADVRAHHLALAALGPDAAVAAEVAGAADRARDRAAPAIACDLYQRAAALSTTLAGRGRMLRRAAAAAVAAGDLSLAAALAGQADPLTATGPERAALAEVRAAVEFERGDQAAAARLLVAGAPEAEPGTSASMLRTAATPGSPGTPTRCAPAPGCSPGTASWRGCPAWWTETTGPASPPSPRPSPRAGPACGRSTRRPCSATTGGRRNSSPPKWPADAGPAWWADSPRRSRYWPGSRWSRAGTATRRHRWPRPGPSPRTAACRSASAGWTWPSPGSPRSRGTRSAAGRWPRAPSTAG
ncbi:AAA family ATPase [Streptomyces sp. NPDC001546]|uniref:AAA family ATPase n=1 Tax=Streptomyces sp. NPDC001546 TaxID=3364585 RepID=UPI0036845A4C